MRTDLPVRPTPAAGAYPFLRGAGSTGGPRPTTRPPLASSSGCGVPARTLSWSHGRPSGGLTTTRAFISTCAQSSAASWRTIASWCSTCGRGPGCPERQESRRPTRSEGAGSVAAENASLLALNPLQGVGGRSADIAVFLLRGCPQSREGGSCLRADLRERVSRRHADFLVPVLQRFGQFRHRLGRLRPEPADGRGSLSADVGVAVLERVPEGREDVLGPRADVAQGPGGVQADGRALVLEQGDQCGDRLPGSGAQAPQRLGGPGADPVVLVLKGSDQVRDRILRLERRQRTGSLAAPRRVRILQRLPPITGALVLVEL